MVNESRIGGIGFIGNRNYYGNTSLGGTCEAIAVWPRALSDEEMEQALAMFVDCAEDADNDHICDSGNGGVCTGGQVF